MPWSKNGKRDYKREYALYQGSDEQKKNRAKRNAARATMMKKGAVKKGDGKDVDHSRAISKGGSNKPSNLVAISMQANRSFARNKNSTMRSQKSKRER
jgi:hypothetical protein